jgi:ABC-type branched-subunit amino acid transport system permease subunit
VVLLAILVGIAGLVIWGDQGRIMLVAAFALGGLAGLELAVREHFGGYRSHSSLLAACTAFAAGAVMVIALPGPAPRVPTVLVAIAVFAVAFWLFREAFKRRSGGLGFR